MTTHQEEIRGLIADATLVSSYAARVGQLQLPGLMATAARIEGSLQTGGPKPEDYALFLKQFSDAVHAIAPVTLLDLSRDS